MQLTRRSFVSLAGGAALAGVPLVRSLASQAAPATRLKSRPGNLGKLKSPLAPGLHHLGLSTTGRDGLLYVAKGIDGKKPAPLILALHGATQAGELMTTRLAGFADSLGAAILAPDSRDMSWDAVRGDFGVDPAFIDRAMAWTFDLVSVDPARLWLAGFSDGASYGLSLGIANGDLFSRLLAFSPGFVIPTERRGKPKIYVSHGRQDQILPIDRCSRVIVPELKRAGYDVRFDEFEGGHRMPPEILDAAAKWLTT